jgi:hypothetical protein
MVLFTPCGSLSVLLVLALDGERGATLAHRGQTSQAALPDPVLRAGADPTARAAAHSARQNIQPQQAILPLALCGDG